MKKFFKRILGMGILSASLLVGAFVPAASANTTITRTNENTTSYLSDADDKNAAGLWYMPGDVAVHPKVWGTVNPIYPFGSKLVTTTNITISDGTRSTFWVNDVGEKWNENNYSYGWVDIWFGLYSDSRAVSLANNWGNDKRLNYTVTIYN